MTIERIFAVGMTRQASRSLALAVLVVVGYQTVLALGGGFDWSDGGQLWDSDCYMRLQRVMNLFETGDWFDSFEPRSNAPYGEQLHWTRPLDAILYAGAWIGGGLTDFRSALWAWGLVVSPVLLVATVAVWHWGTGRILGPWGFVLSVLLFLSLPILKSAYAFGRPDHHSLIALCQAGAMAGLLRTLSGDRRPHPALYAGIWAGLGIWTSVESLAGQGVIGIIVALLWIWRGGAEARWLAAFGRAMAATLCLALVIEYQPTDWLHVRYARFTIVDVVLALSCWASWEIVGRLTRSRKTTLGQRLGLVLAAAAVILAVMAALFPGFFSGPTSDYSERARAWLGTITEMQPLWPSRIEDLPPAILGLGPNVIAILWCAVALARSAPPRQDMAFCLLVGNLVFVPFILAAKRWGYESGLWALLPWTLAAMAAWRWPGTLTVAGRPVPMRLVPTAAVLGLPLGIAALLSACFPFPAPQKTTALGCSWSRAAPYLSRTWPAGTIVLAPLFEGGEILWRTPLAVVGTPYQNGDGLADTDDVLQAIDDAKAEAILRRRGVSLLILCRDSHYDAAITTPDTLYRRLMAGQGPSWLTPLAPPDEIGTRFLMLGTPFR